MTDVVYLECIESGASKFWSGTVEGKVLTTRWGKIATQGQSKEETFEDAASAKASLDKQAAVKVKKGYKPAAAGGRQQSAPATKTSGANASKVASKKRSGNAARAMPNLSKVASTKAASTKAAAARSPMPITKPQLTAWLKAASRTGSELAAAEGKFPETDRLIAAHTAALPETLSTLSLSSDKATRARVAANPNTPPGVLVRSAVEFPAEFLTNPVFDLLLLEDPCFWNRIPLGRFFSEVRWLSCPDSFWVWCTASANWEQILSEKPDLELLEIIRDMDGDSERYENLSGLELVDVIVPEFKFMVFKKSVSGNLLSFLACASEPKVRTKVADHPNTTAESLTVLANDEDTTVRGRVAGNMRTPLPVLEALANDSELTVRSAVARSPYTPAVIAVPLLESLAETKDVIVRGLVAENTHTPLPVLSKLAKDKVDSVRSQVASNPKTPVPILEKLAQDRNQLVRGAVAGNINTPIPVLDLLATDRNSSIRSEAARNPQLPRYVAEKLAKDKNPLARRRIAENPATPAAVLEMLALDKDESVQDAVASNPHTPAHVLETLLLLPDERDDLWDAIAGNVGTPTSILESLACAAERRLRLCVARNPSSPVEVLKLLSADSIPLVSGMARQKLAERNVDG